MNLKQKIAYYAQCKRYDKIARQIRLRVYDYEDSGTLDKAHRILRRIASHNAKRDRNRRSKAEDRRLNPQIH